MHERQGLQFLELTKPRLTSLVLVTTGVGFWLGWERPDALGRLVPLLLGTACVAGGANALNQWWERDLDAQMVRTKNRPLPSGRLSADAARWFGVALMLIGVAWLAFSVNGLAAALAALSAASYVVVYTPMKRLTSLCTLVGAIPGALPPMIGWAGARGTLGVEAWALFALLFVWQLPHFLALAQLYREQYAGAGFQMLSVTEPEGVTAAQILLYGLVLVPVSLFPAFLGVAGTVYGVGALGLSLMFLWLSIRAASRRSPASMRALFAGSIVYLSLLLALLAADKPSTASAAEALMPPDLGAVPEFALVDQQAQPVTGADLDGTVWVADFIFTRCAGQCPMMTAQMSALQSRLAGLGGVQLVSFTVDPATDTPAVLETYARQHGAEPARWRFLTGEQEAIWSLARNGFKLGVGADGTPEEPITHSVRLVLVDQQRRIRGYYDATDRAAVDRLVRDIGALVQAQRTAKQD